MRIFLHCFLNRTTKSTKSRRGESDKNKRCTLEEFTRITCMSDNIPVNHTFMIAQCGKLLNLKLVMKKIPEDRPVTVYRNIIHKFKKKGRFRLTLYSNSLDLMR